MRNYENAAQLIESLCGEAIKPAPQEERDKRFLATDDAVASFATEREFCSALKFREEHDLELEVLPSNFRFGAYMYDAPLVNPMLSQQYGDQDVPDPMLKNATDGPDATCLLMRHPAMDGCHYTWHPVMQTALMGVCRVTGLSGQSLMRTVPTTGKRVMDPALKTKVLNAGKDLYNPAVKVLIRDGEVAGLRTSKYAVLDQTDGYQAVRKYCIDTYGEEAKFHAASMSEATTVAELNCGEEALVNLKQRLLDAGVVIPKVSLIIRYVTSDVTDSAMRAEPFILWGEGGKEALLIPFGEGVAMRHETGNTVEGFSAKLPELVKSQQEAEDTIEELGNTEIEHLDGCLQRVAMTTRLGLSDAVVKQQIDKMTASGITSGTAIDVFLSLQECIMNQCRKGNALDVEKYVQMTESSARLLSVRYKLYDLPVDPDLYQ